MDYRVTAFLCFFVMMVSAYPSEEGKLRARRDVMDSVKGMWNEVVKTLSDAGDAVVHVFKPTEKSVFVKLAEGAEQTMTDAGGAIVHVFKPTEKSVIDKMADGIKNLGQ